MISMFMSGGPSHIDLFDPKPDAGEVRRREVPRLGHPARQRRGRHLDGDGQPLQVPEVRRVGDRALGARAAPGRGRRRHHADPLDEPAGDQEPRRRPARPEQRAGPGGPAGAGELADLRPGLGEPRAARVRRPAGRQPAPRLALLVEQLPAVDLPGDRRPQPGAAHPQPRPPRGPEGGAAGRNLALLDRLNRLHLDRHPGETDLEARIASYELAARMQTAAKEAFDVGRESAETRALYGIDQTRDAEARRGLPDRPPPGRARRPLRADLRQRLGPPRGHHHDTCPGASRPPTSPPRPWSRT